jgi:hypothetical protein
VTVTYLSENGAPIVKPYTVPATSRFNIDVKTMVPELIDASFGACIDVTNDAPICGGALDVLERPRRILVGRS